MSEPRFIINEKIILDTAGIESLHGTKCSCGGIWAYCEELGIRGNTVFIKKGDAWYAKDALICDRCGAHYVPTDAKRPNF